MTPISLHLLKGGIVQVSWASERLRTISLRHNSNTLTRSL